MESSAQPLAGKRIVITRAREQAQELARQLESLGAEVIFLPLVTIAEAKDSAPLDEAIRNFRSFEWVLFTSRNAVSFFVKRFEEVMGSVSGLRGEKPALAAVGPGTEAALASRGLRVAHVARIHRGEALAEELSAQLKGKRVLLPRSDLAGHVLPEKLRKAGADVTEVIAYRTLAGENSEASWERIRRGDADIITFASPSAFHNFEQEAGADGAKTITVRAVFAAIGPVTAQAIRAAGYAAEIEAADSSLAGFVRAIVEFCTRRHSGVPS